MKKRLDELKEDLIEETMINQMPFQIKPQDIIQKVDIKLKEDEEQRKIIMKQKRFKLAIACSLIIFAGSIGYAGTNGEIIKNFFGKEDSTKTKIAESKIDNEIREISDGRFKFTMFQILSSQRRTIFYYSFQGLTDEAIKHLMSKEFDNMDTFYVISKTKPKKSSFIEEILGTNEELFSSGGTSEIKEKRTEDTRFFISDVYYPYKQSEGFSIKLGEMKEGYNKIDIPIKINLESKNLILKGQESGDIQIILSPIEYTVMQGIKVKENGRFKNIKNIFFKTKDDKIKTFSELTKPEGMYDTKKIKTNSGYKGYGYYGNFREITDFNDFKSIIVNNIEYDFKNPEKTKPFEVPEHLKPFEIKPSLINDLLEIPAYEVFTKLKANPQLNEDKSELNLVWRKDKFKIKANSTTIDKNGQKLYVNDYNKEEKINIKDGIMYIPVETLIEIFKINVDIATTKEEEKTLEDRIFLIIP